MLWMALLGLAFAQTVAQVTNSPPPYPALYVFGSSWADTRNGPYFNGHWSNGPMWPEYLSTNLGLAYLPKNNFAVGGSVVTDVLGQVNAFHAPTNAAACLFHFWAGYTDFYDIDNLTNDMIWNVRIRTRVNTLSNALVKLYIKGARSILVPNVFDRSHDPAFIALWRNDSVSREHYPERIDSFNTAWADALGAIDANFPDLRLYTFDFHTKFNELVAGFATAGFTKADPDVLDDPALSNKNFTGPGKDYLYWDGHHTTSKAHAIYAGWFEQTLSQTILEKVELARTGGELVLQMNKLRLGATYTLQTSPDASHWSDIQSFAASAGTNSWSTPLPNQSAGFFRLKLETHP
jgi:phospholipase/lecithinase/hemolysin